MSTETYCSEAHQGRHAVSIGWLGKKVSNRGPISSNALKSLRYFRDRYFHNDGDLGSHECEICGQGHFHGEFWVQVHETRYVLPAGIFHYIEEHGYCPPQQFLRDVASLELPKHEERVTSEDGASSSAQNT